MANWIISVPVWGPTYLRTFTTLAVPALRIAVERLGHSPKLLIHTDEPDAVKRALAGFDVEARPISKKPTYTALQEGHADAVRSAAVGDVVVLLNADLVVSANFLEACADHIADRGKLAVVLLGIRVLRDNGDPPIGAQPRALLEWGWAHRHQIIRDLEWPQGRSMLPTNLFWELGKTVVARGFHLHPAAIVKHADIRFQSTIDGDLLDYFPREKIHVVTSPDDCAMLEVGTPPDRRFGLRTQPQSPPLVAGAMRTRASATHRWLFTHRIVVAGDGEELRDEEIAQQILSHMGDETTFHRPQKGKTPMGARGR